VLVLVEQDVVDLSDRKSHPGSKLSYMVVTGNAAGVGYWSSMTSGQSHESHGETLVSHFVDFIILANSAGVLVGFPCKGTQTLPECSGNF
jgi:hypothetical protein